MYTERDERDSSSVLLLCLGRGRRSSHFVWQARGRALRSFSHFPLCLLLLICIIIVQRERGERYFARPVALYCSWLAERPFRVPSTRSCSACRSHSSVLPACVIRACSSSHFKLHWLALVVPACFCESCPVAVAPHLVYYSHT